MDVAECGVGSDYWIVSGKVLQQVKGDEEKGEE